MDIDDIYELPLEDCDYHYRDVDFEDVYNSRIGKRKGCNNRRKSKLKDVIGCIQGLLVIAAIIGGLFLFSTIYNSCMGAIARALPDDGTYYATDEWDYYHKRMCGCVNEDNVDGYFESKEEAENEGLEPCPYCISEDE